MVIELFGGGGEVWGGSEVSRTLVLPVLRAAVIVACGRRSAGWRWDPRPAVSADREREDSEDTRDSGHKDSTDDESSGVRKAGGMPRLQWRSDGPF